MLYRTNRFHVILLLKSFTHFQYHPIHLVIILIARSRVVIDKGIGQGKIGFPWKGICKARSYVDSAGVSGRIPVVISVHICSKTGTQFFAKIIFPRNPDPISLCSVNVFTAIFGIGDGKSYTASLQRLVECKGVIRFPGKSSQGIFGVLNTGGSSKGKGVKGVGQACIPVRVIRVGRISVVNPGIAPVAKNKTFIRIFVPCSGGWGVPVVWVDRILTGIQVIGVKGQL